MNIQEIQQAANILLNIRRDKKIATFEYKTVTRVENKTIPLYDGNFTLTGFIDTPFSLRRAIKDRTGIPGYYSVKFSKDSVLKLIVKWLDETIYDSTSEIDNNKFSSMLERIKKGIEHHHRFHNTQEKTSETLGQFDQILIGWDEKSYKELKKCLKSARYNPLLEASKEDGVDVQDGLFCVMALMLPATTMQQVIARTIKPEPEVSELKA